MTAVIGCFDEEGCESEIRWHEIRRGYESERRPKW